jgi:hypothetical protein
MNPWGLFIVALGVVGIVVGVKTVQNPITQVVKQAIQPVINAVHPPAVTAGGPAPASPGATETIGGKTYHPVPNPHGPGYVWGLVPTVKAPQPVK